MVRVSSPVRHNLSLRILELEFRDRSSDEGLSWQDPNLGDMAIECPSYEQSLPLLDQIITLQQRNVPLWFRPRILNSVLSSDKVNLLAMRHLFSSDIGRYFMASFFSELFPRGLHGSVQEVLDCVFIGYWLITFER